MFLYIYECVGAEHPLGEHDSGTDIRPGTWIQSTNSSQQQQTNQIYKKLFLSDDHLNDSLIENNNYNSQHHATINNKKVGNLNFVLLPLAHFTFSLHRPRFFLF